MGNKTGQSVTLDKYARDADTWFAYGNVIYCGARALFEAGAASPELYFTAATLGHSSLEILMKAILIQEGMVSFDPKKIKRLSGAVLDANDCVWGHSLMELAEELERRTEFDLDDEMKYRDILHQQPFCVRDALKVFAPFFEELRYPQALEQIKGFGGGDDHILEELVTRIGVLKRD